MAESVDHFAAIIWIYASLFEAVLLVRAWQTKNLSQFPSFYAYIAFLFLTSGILLPIYLLWPSYYPSAFWFRFTIQLLLEFMVLLEVSDHIFSRYVAICHLGKLLTLGICIVFAVFYIYPSLVSQEGQAAVILEFNKRVAFTKAIIIVVLLAAIVRFHIHLGRNTSGILLGFSVYLAIVVVNLALEERYGQALYGRVFAAVGPLGYVLSLTIWAASLWRLDPVPEERLEAARRGDASAEAVAYQLEKFNSVLFRLLGR